MDREKKYKLSNLSRALLLGKKPLSRYRYEFSSKGRFDEQKNYVCGYWGHRSVKAPWEWVMDPDIVKYAKQLGVEIPEDPDIDMSRTF